MDCRTALLTILDQIDYTNGACGPTEMIGAILPKTVITLARKAIDDEAIRLNDPGDAVDVCAFEKPTNPPSQ